MAEIGFFNRVPRNEDNVIARRYVGYKGTKGFPEPALDAVAGDAVAYPFAYGKAHLYHARL